MPTSLAALKTDEPFEPEHPKVGIAMANAGQTLGDMWRLDPGIVSMQRAVRASQLEGTTAVVACTGSAAAARRGARPVALSWSSMALSRSLGDAHPSLSLRPCRSGLVEERRRAPTLLSGVPLFSGIPSLPLTPTSLRRSTPTQRGLVALAMNATDAPLRQAGTIDLLPVLGAAYEAMEVAMLTAEHSIVRVR